MGKKSQLIKVQYFKPSGKFYGDGEYHTEMKQGFGVIAEFELMLKQGTRPGLVDGHSGYTAVIDCSLHPTGYPAMFPGKA